MNFNSMNSLLRGEAKINCHLASSLDSPKPLTIHSNDSDEGSECNYAPKSYADSLVSKRNSCPNLEVEGLILPQPYVACVGKKRVPSGPYLQSTSSLTEGDTLRLSGKAARKKHAIFAPIQTYSDAPRIELSPPEECHRNDHIPLLASEYQLTECDRETCV